MNSVVIAGHLGQDVVLKAAGSKTVANFSIAINKGFGENKSTIWMNVVAWGGLADIAAQNLGKGTYVTITGRLDVRKFTNKSGQETTVTEIVANSIGLMEQKSEGSQDRGGRASGGSNRSFSGRRAPQPQIEDEDIPF
jgi:single-strand DNA-binding protein